MTDLDNVKRASKDHQLVPFTAYFLVGSGILVAIMFLGATYYLASMT
jgi:hypothetical protein